MQQGCRHAAACQDRLATALHPPTCRLPTCQTLQHATQINKPTKQKPTCMALTMTIGSGVSMRTRLNAPITCSGIQPCAACSGAGSDGQAAGQYCVLLWTQGDGRRQPAPRAFTRQALKPLHH